MPDVTDVKINLLLLIYLSYCNIKKSRHGIIIKCIYSFFLDAISLGNTSVTSAVAYSQTIAPFTCHRLVVLCEII